MTLLDIAGLLVDDQVGIISHVAALPRDAGAPDLVYMSAETCKLMTPDQCQRAFVGSGVATERSSAMAKAVGEAIERYCAANYAVDDLPLASYESAEFPCARPDEFALFSPAQYAQVGFPYRPFTEETRVCWVPALDLDTRDTRYVPAGMVFLPYDERRIGEPLITQQISTGLACHSDPMLAALKAICEVIERDAIAITWQARLPRPQIRPDSLSPRNRELLGRLRQPGAFVSLFYLSMDHDIPVIFSMMRSAVPEAPALVFAAAAHLDPERAVRKSLEELAQVWSFSQSVKSQRPKFHPGKRWANVVDLESHALVYFAHENVRFAEFLWNSPEQIAFSEINNLSVNEPSHDLLILIDKLRAVNHRALVVDVTSQDVRSLGLHVFRALIPGFHPLFMGYRFRALGGTRLWGVPQKLGYRGLVREQGDNPAPHPFG